MHTTFLPNVGPLTWLLNEKINLFVTRGIQNLCIYKSFEVLYETMQHMKLNFVYSKYENNTNTFTSSWTQPVPHWTTFISSLVYPPLQLVGVALQLNDLYTTSILVIFVDLEHIANWSVKSPTTGRSMSTAQITLPSSIGWNLSFNMDSFSHNDD